MPAFMISKKLSITSRFLQNSQIKIKNESFLMFLAVNMSRKNEYFPRQRGFIMAICLATYHLKKRKDF
jgi:hypothetical protein